MAGISFVKVIDAGPRYTTVLADDGKTYTLKGDRNWRNNNPGNIEYGDFAKSMGAIGTDGRFAVFPSVDMGNAAQETLQFEGKSYRDKSIADAISRYAPEFENDTAAYAAEVAAAAGVPLSTKMRDLTPKQRAAFLAAQHRVEGMKAGTIMGAEGEAVSPEVAQQFAAVRLPPASIGGTGNDVTAYQQQLADRGFDPGPVDGVKGPRTTAAVKAFQKANGLVEDGIVGPKTRAALNAQQGSYTFDPPPIPGNEEMPSRASFWQEAGKPPSTLTQITEGDTRAEQRTLGGGAPQGSVLGFRPLPGPAPLTPQEDLPPTAPEPRMRPTGAPSVPLPRVRPEPPQTGGGFDLGAMLGNVGNTLGQTAQQLGTTLGNTTKNVVEGTGRALANTGEAAKEALTNELLRTVGGRTLAFNTMMGIEPRRDRAADRRNSAPEGYAYGSTGNKLYKIGGLYNSRNGQVRFDGSKFVPVGGVKTALDVTPPGGSKRVGTTTTRTTGPNVVDEVGALRYHG
jgi:peptidoglycan hydrolase-like protein with peptidoglycan-binding domain